MPITSGQVLNIWCLQMIITIIWKALKTVSQTMNIIQWAYLILKIQNRQHWLPNLHVKLCLITLDRNEIYISPPASSWMFLYSDCDIYMRRDAASIWNQVHITHCSSFYLQQANRSNISRHEFVLENHTSVFLKEIFSTESTSSNTTKEL